MHNFSTGWALGVVKMKSVEKKKSVAGQFAVKYNESETLLASKFKQGRLRLHTYSVTQSEGWCPSAYSRGCSDRQG